MTGHYHSPDDPPPIVVEGLANRFGDFSVHENLDLTVRRGEILGVVGGSGSGKSVLMRSIIGLQRPAEGRIDVLGHTITGVDLDSGIGVRRRWGVLFQGGALFSTLTVGENVEVALRKYYPELSPELRAEIARYKVILTGLPESAVAKFPSELSGGMKKRAGLARALALDPELLFLDEPTAGLDPIAATAFDELVLYLRDTLRLTIVMVTHDLDTLMRTCDRVAVLVDGKVIVDTLEGIVANDHPWIRHYFHGARGRSMAASREDTGGA
jgi:phospholipid/cholesterol/gamma-HCH transport system ATP-binding protein